MLGSKRCRALPSGLSGPCRFPGLLLAWQVYLPDRVDRKGSEAEVFNSGQASGNPESPRGASERPTEVSMPPLGDSGFPSAGAATSNGASGFPSAGAATSNGAVSAAGAFRVFQNWGMRGDFQR